jgi:hypothetical protein
MILYHGTSERHLRAIQRHGLLPRRRTGESNWSGNVTSKEGFVYLTDAYPVYFAVGPALAAEHAPADLLILKVDVDEDRLYPDEDFIAWAVTDGAQGARQEEMNPFIDPRAYKDAWRLSLEYNGVVCTPAISPDRVLDYRVIPRSEAELIAELGIEPLPTPMNYRFMGSHYRRCIELLFDQGPEAAVEVIRQRWEMTGATGACNRVTNPILQGLVAFPEG